MPGMKIDRHAGGFLRELTVKFGDEIFGRRGKAATADLEIWEARLEMGSRYRIEFDQLVDVAAPSGSLAEIGGF